MRRQISTRESLGPAPEPRTLLARWSRRPPRTACLREFSLRWRPPAAGRTQCWYVALWWDGRQACAAAARGRRPRVSATAPKARWRAWQRQAPWWVIGETVALKSLAVGKPWGRELWFTGIEKRGVCAVEVRGGEIPLPIWQFIVPDSPSPLRAPPLLKILEPRPEPVHGDLYFELHRRKREVYVVIDVDQDCWPGGAGAVRFGMDQRMREQYGDDQGFLADFVAAAARYEALRRRIDSIAASDLPASLAREEVTQRRSLEAFSNLQAVRSGDVVQVAPGIPHALQHGVRVLEFQTPVYERMILSFAQRVRTQAHWDTAAAMRILQLDPPPAVSSLDQRDWAVVTVFEDFALLGMHLQPGIKAALPSRRWGLLAVLGAGIVVHQLRSETLSVQPEQAVWLGARARSVEIIAAPSGAQLLLAVNRASVAAKPLL